MKIHYSIQNYINVINIYKPTCILVRKWPLLIIFRLKMEYNLKRIKFLEELLTSNDEIIASKNETIASIKTLFESKD